MIKKFALTYLILTLAILFSGGLFIYFYRPVVQPVINTNANTNVNLNQPSTTAEIISPTKTDCADELDTECWNTYRNTEYGFEFKYPMGWRSEKSNSGIEKIGFISDSKSLYKDGVLLDNIVLASRAYKITNKDNSLDLNRFDFGTQVGPLKYEKIVYLNDREAKEFVFEGDYYYDLGFGTALQNNKPILITYIMYINDGVLFELNFQASGHSRLKKLQFFEENILSTFNFI